MPNRYTTFHPLIQKLHLGQSLLAILALFLVFSLHAASAHCSENNTNTYFLPLKINADSDVSLLTDKTDKALTAAVTMEEFSVIPRPTVELSIGYSGTWPPSFDKIHQIAPEGTDYLVAGSLTRAGSSFSIDMVVFDVLDRNRTKYFYEETKSIADLQKIFNRISSHIISFTNRYSKIASINIDGNKKIDSGAILQKIKINSGDLYDPAKLRQAIKSIYKMGYFANIEVHMTESERGKIIIFDIQEKAVIGQITIIGEDEIEADEIREVIAVVPNNIINNLDIKSSVENIKQLYKEKGLYNTKVASELTHTNAEKIDVIFKIKEGHKVFIKEITVTGNKAFKTSKLKKILQTSERNWLSWITDSGLLNHDIVEQDAGRIGSFYHNNGYIDAMIGKPEITQKGEWLYINFNISEGERYRIGTVDMHGDFVEDKTALLMMARIKDEEYFNRKIMRDDSQRLTDKFAEKGYAFADIKSATEKDTLNKRVNINFDMEKNELVYINRINIKGNSRTRDKVIRREIMLKEAGIFNATALKRSHSRLQRLGFFEKVEVTPVPTDDETLMDLMVTVEEKATGNFSIGAGYSSIDSFMFMSEIKQSNFLGKGQSMSLQANLSGNSTQYNWRFTEPRLADSRLLFGFDIYDWRRDYDDYTKDSQGFGVRFGYPLFPGWRTSGSYTFDSTTLEDVSEFAAQDIIDSMAIKYTSSLQASIGHDSRNRGTDASKGRTYSLTVKYAGGPLGGDAEFTKFEANTNWYYPLPFETIFHYKVAAGWAFSNSDDKLPVFERFYLGGINSIRGFKNANISPRDPITDEKIGGAKMWYTNIEYIFPLVKEAGLKGLVFFDAGNVYEEDADWDFGEIKKSVGFGFRWLSPMGPLRLEYGYNIDPKDDEVQGNWDFSIGGAF